MGTLKSTQHNESKAAMKMGFPAHVIEVKKYLLESNDPSADIMCKLAPDDSAYIQDYYSMWNSVMRHSNTEDDLWVFPIDMITNINKGNN